MKLTSVVHQFNFRIDGNASSSFSAHAVRVFGAAIFATTLALAPLPTFAQHGGGGGGGSHGGGGGGGSHGGGGGGSHTGGGSHPSGAGASSGSGHAGTSAPSANSGSGTSHWWGPFHGSGANASAHQGATGAAGSSGANAGESSDHVAAERFAAGNNTWQEPPAAGGHAVSHTGTVNGPVNGTVNGARTNSSAPRAAVASPPHVPVPPRRGGNGYYYPYYPYYGGLGFGFGGGFGYFGAFGPCDPFWGCYGYGYGYSLGYGGGSGYGYYGGGGSSGYSASADLSYSGGDDSAPSQEPNPTLYAQAPETSQQPETAVAGPAGTHVVAVLYLKNGSSYAVTDYWLADGKVHYVTSYGGENAIDESDLDLQRTVNENATQGLTFGLRPAPANGVAMPTSGETNKN
jgi:hypothetical protein